MRKLLLFLLVLPLFSITVQAAEIETIQEDQFGTAALEDGLPDGAEEMLQGIDFGDNDFSDGAAQIFSKSMVENRSTLVQAVALAAVVIGVVLLCGTLRTVHEAEGIQPVAIAGALGITTACAFGFQAMIQLGANTVQSLSDYSTLLLPALASSTIASGGVSSGAALYTGTVLFTNVLSAMVSKLLVPMVYLFIGVATANAAMANHLLDSIRDFIAWLISTSLKAILYIFTGYLTISGIISGSADAASVKATKLAIGNMIPVVGGIISDAAETVLVSASLLKNSIGIFGMLAVLAVCVTPLLRIAIHYLILKVTKAVCGTVGSKNHVELVGDLSTAMGFLLGMTGTCALMLLISTVCSLRVIG